MSASGRSYTRDMRRVRINVDRFDDETLRAAGLQDGQPVVAEVVAEGLLLRSTDEAPIDRAAAEAIIGEHSQTIERLGR